MRIALDLQACQAANKFQGIGRASLEFTRALLRNAGPHEVILAINAGFPIEADRLKAALANEALESQFVAWRTHTPVDYHAHGDSADYRNAQQTRNQFFASLGVDVVHTLSLFEGFGDDAVTTISEQAERAHIESATLYDLIPLINESVYLKDEKMRRWYMDRIDALKRADLLLAISESSRKEGLEYLHVSEDAVASTSLGVDNSFKPASLSAEQVAALKSRYGIHAKYVMYSGGIETRKNVDRLVHAYAALPSSVRSGTQLAIVCRISESDRDRLTALALEHGLKPADLVFTGYVSDEDLVNLYSTCDLFVFPSWHEGFGLPVLEAMACGAPVITSDRTSLPEVLGHAEALFDPLSVESISALMKRALEDRDFRRALASHGLERAKEFTWDAVALRAIKAFEVAHAGRQARSVEEVRPSMAFVSPLPPEQSGISYYSIELLPELSKFYDIVVVTPEVKGLDSDHLAPRVVRRSVEWFEQHANKFDRIVYQFGNSSFHGHMFDLLARFAGVVVLHDFFLSGIVAHLDYTGDRPGMWAEYLYRSHGYVALLNMEQADDSSSPIWKYPASLPVLQRAIATIVHSANSRMLAEHWYGAAVAKDLVHIPHLRRLNPPIAEDERLSIRRRLGIPDHALLVCSFGHLGANKQNHALLEAWRAGGYSDREDAYLVFVGEASQGAYADRLRELVGENGARCWITGFADSSLYRDFLNAADVAVQLRSLSRGETSGAVLDCMATGLPVLVNANGAMAELPAGTALVLDDEFSTKQLVQGLERLCDPAYRAAMSTRQREYVARELDPEVIARSYWNAIEAAYAAPAVRSMYDLAQSLRGAPDRAGSAEEWERLASAVAYNTRVVPAPPQLLIDVSELVKVDARSGIQRVVHGVLGAFFQRVDLPYRVEPVYTAGDGVYRYARRFTKNYLGLTDSLEDEQIDFAAGDVFLGLDVAPVEIAAAERFLQQMRLAGVKTYFVFYDALPLQRPDCFPPEAAGIFCPWMMAMARSASGVICISRTIAQDFHDAMDVLAPNRATALPIWSFPLGISLAHEHLAVASQDLPALRTLGNSPIVLMVGTVEPRKGYGQALGAFEELWRRGSDLQLVIVGKQGWMVEALAERISSHPENGRKLHWFNGVSDEVLNALYQRAHVLLSASEAEGYGLPLIEALARGVPVLARDIPVFREVAGDRASYFEGFEADELAEAIENYFGSSEQIGNVASFDYVPATWMQSAQALIDIFRADAAPVMSWKRGARDVIWAADPRVRTEVGTVRHGRISSNGQGGVLFVVSDLRLAAGEYVLVVDSGSEAPLAAQVEVVAGGSGIILRAELVAQRTTEVTFELDKGGEIEVRILVASGGRAAIRQLTLDQVPKSAIASRTLTDVAAVG